MSRLLEPIHPPAGLMASHPGLLAHLFKHIDLLAAIPAKPLTPVPELRMPLSPPVRHERGFTLVELIVTLAVAAILLGVAAPSFKSAIENSRNESAMLSLLGDLQFARSEAIKRSSRVSVCARQSNTECGSNWSTGWLVFVDNQASAGSIDAGETVLRVGQSVSPVQVNNRARTASGMAAPVQRDYIRFGPRGTSHWRGGGSFTFCRTATDSAPAAEADAGSSADEALNVMISGDLRRARKNGDGDLISAFNSTLACPS